MPPVGFEPAIPKSEWPQIHTLDHTVTEIGLGFLTEGKCFTLVFSSISISFSNYEAKRRKLTGNLSMPCTIYYYYYYYFHFLHQKALLYNALYV
jgi:hypothetical protein